MITWENYEDYMMLQADGELAASKAQELQAFIKQHPRLQAEMAAFETVRFTPDTTQVFAGKEQLLKPVPVKKVIPLKQWWLYGAAACVLVIFFISMAQWQHKPAANNIATVHKPIDNNKIDKLVIPVSDTLKAVAIQKEKKIPALPKHTIAIKKELNAVAKKKVADQKEAIAVAPVISPKPVVIDPPTPVVKEQETQAAPVVAYQKQVPEKNKSFLALLPIDEEKKENIAGIKDALNDKVQQVKAIGKGLKNIRNTDFILKVGGKEIAFNL